MDMHQKGAARIAEWLQGRTEMKEVFFPGLPGHPGREIHESQADGPGGIVSFRLQTEEMTKKFLSEVQLPALAVSLGGVESIITYPITMSHAAMHLDHRIKVGVTGDLVRLSVGIEDPDDLIEDLGSALSRT
jgi:cystathionine beta-lyase